MRLAEARSSCTLPMSQVCSTDEMDRALLPTFSGCCMRVGQQRPVDTPDQKQTHAQRVFEAVNAITGALFWLVWERTCRKTQTSARGRYN